MIGGLKKNPGPIYLLLWTHAGYLYSGCKSHTQSSPTQVSPHCRQTWAAFTWKRNWGRSQVILHCDSLLINNICSLLNVSFSKYAFVSARTCLGWRLLLFQASGPIEDLVSYGDRWWLLPLFSLPITVPRDFTQMVKCWELVSSHKNCQEIIHIHHPLLSLALFIRFYCFFQ